MLSTTLDLLGVCLIGAFAWFVWEPLPLAVAGAAVLLASWRRSQSPPTSEGRP